MTTPWPAETRTARSNCGTWTLAAISSGSAATPGTLSLRNAGSSTFPSFTTNRRASEPLSCASRTGSDTVRPSIPRRPGSRSLGVPNKLDRRQRGEGCLQVLEDLTADPPHRWLNPGTSQPHRSRRPPRDFGCDAHNLRVIGEVQVLPVGGGEQRDGPPGSSPRQVKARGSSMTTLASGV